MAATLADNVPVAHHLSYSRLDCFAVATVTDQSRYDCRISSLSTCFNVGYVSASRLLNLRKLSTIFLLV